MSLVTPTLNLPVASSAAPAKPALPASPPAPPVPLPPVARPPEASSTVTLSPQALSALAASHATAAAAPGAAPTGAAPAPASPHDASLYDALKHGIATAVTDVGDTIADGAHAVVAGAESALSTAHDVVKGTLALPFAAVATACDAVGSLIDEL